MKEIGIFGHAVVNSGQNLKFLLKFQPEMLLNTDSSVKDYQYENNYNVITMIIWELMLENEERRVTIYKNLTPEVARDQFLASS